ncbi:helix-turn-helix domain-containing protein [Streptomyces sp. NPDC017673]|uniref:helix-turn-helix domain-containing protein n=1 Tax=unclassified Streptomyces TaxID=2593676 RepID=UPI00379DA2E2
MRRQSRPGLASSAWTHTRRDLAEADLHTVPIHAVAARRGFPDAADFSRAFRDTYGVPPTEYRQQTLRARWTQWARC